MGSLTNGNDYRRGWEEGRKDALDGNDKNYIRMGLSWKFAFHGNTALESYTDGYNKGYEAGINERNVVRKVELVNNGTDNISNKSKDMEQGQDLMREWDALKNLYDFLVRDVCNMLCSMDNRFKHYIGVMVETGVQVQECAKFRDSCYQVDKNNFNSLINNIIQNDLPAIGMYIEEVRKQFAVLCMDPGSANLSYPDLSFSAPSTYNVRKGAEQDYVKQLDAICDLMDFLAGLSDELIRVREGYQKYCSQMLEAGVPIQVTEHYVQNYAKDNYSHITQTAKHIAKEDYSQLNGLFQQVYLSLTALGNSYSRTPRSMQYFSI